MFSGIVEKMGELKKIETKQGKVYFTIAAGKFLRGIRPVKSRNACPPEAEFNRVKIGDSISCDGVCLTAIKVAGGSFTAELMPETLRRTKFAQAKTGDLINLEKSLRLGDAIGGHFVMGHVDAVGQVWKISKQGADASLTVKAPKRIVKYLAYKGSVALNGVSLTIGPSASLRTGGKGCFTVYLISHTLKITNLGRLKAGDEVNIEVDTIARYLESLLKK